MSDILGVDKTIMYNGKVKIDGTRLIDCETYNIKLSSEAADRIGAYHSDNMSGMLQYRDYQNGYTQIWVGMAGNNDSITSFTPLNQSKGEFTKAQVDDILGLTQKAVSDELKDPEFKLNVQQLTSNTEFAEEKVKKPSLLESLKARLHKNNEASEKKSFEQMSARDQWRYENGGIG